MGHIVGELKAFARKEPARLQSVSLQQVVAGALMLVEPLRHASGTRIATDTLDFRVWGDPIQPDRLIELRLQATETHVNITVRDHGLGLSADAQAHLFEPFFTTKPSGKGLGLGLSLSHAIVHEMGGSIRADNAHPGACFTLSLPRAPEPNADPPP